MRGTEAESASNDANFLQNSARKVTDFFFISGLNFLAGIAGDLASNRGVSDPRGPALGTRRRTETGVAHAPVVGARLPDSGGTQRRPPSVKPSSKVATRVGT